MDEKMKPISLVFASDDNYAQHVAVACASVLKNTRHPEEVHFYALNDDISSENCSRIEKTVTDLQGQITFLAVNSNLINGFTSGHISKAAYLRLAVADVLPAEVDKVIYFDTDLVVLDDVAELWNYPLQGRPVGAACDFGIMKSKRMRKQKLQTIELDEGKPYFNSGVLVIDLQQWRAQKYGTQVISTIQAHAFRHHDQDGLNFVFKDNWTMLPLRWNVIPPVFTLSLKILLSTKLRRTAVQAAENPAVFHWAGRYKPWEFSLNGPFNRLYYFYLKETAFKDMPMPRPGKDMEGKSIGRQNLRIKIADFFKRLF